MLGNFVVRHEVIRELDDIGWNLATEPSLWPGQSYGTVFLQQFVKQTLLARSSANSKVTFFLCASTMFDFDFCNALPVRARVGSGTITAIYYYYYYCFRNWVMETRAPPWTLALEAVALFDSRGYSTGVSCIIWSSRRVVGGEADRSVAAHHSLRSFWLRSRPCPLSVPQQLAEVHWNLRPEGNATASHLQRLEYALQLTEL